MISTEDKQLAQELGIDGLTDEVIEQQIQEFYETLQVKVGQAFERMMSDEQLLDFEAVVNKGDDVASEDWLIKAFPDYQEVISLETEKLKQEVQATAARFRKIIDEDSSDAS